MIPQVEDREMFVVDDVQGIDAQIAPMNDEGRFRGRAARGIDDPAAMRGIHSSRPSTLSSSRGRRCPHPVGLRAPAAFATRDPAGDRSAMPVDDQGTVNGLAAQRPCRSAAWFRA